MSSRDTHFPQLHEDPALFKEALNFTSATSGFSMRLAEKDYFCSVALSHLAHEAHDLVFKGGTCLAKVHAEFYRLSEDLDFLIPIPCDASRSVRSLRARVLAPLLDGLVRGFPAFRIERPFTGHNNSSEYTATVEYVSRISGHPESIRLEVALREPLLTPARALPAHTLLLDPVSGFPFVEPVAITCLSLTESFAEKYRAALSRREPAIRDFFDIDFAALNLHVSPATQELPDLVQRKMSVPGNGPIDTSSARFAALRFQMETRLKPVLRGKDFAAFNLDRAFELVTGMAERLQHGSPSASTGGEP